MNDILNKLWDSTDELHRRFGKFPPKAAETMRVFQEEVREFIEAVNEAEDGMDGNDAICAEGADVIVTILATLSARGIQRSDFFVWCRLVAEKNDAKTDDTHYVNPHTGKITRRKGG